MQKHVQYKILIVDDIPDNRYSIRKSLQQPGYEFAEAHDGVSAIEAVQKQTPDIVLLDVRMPGLDGFEICNRIRDQFPFIPVVFITANMKDVIDQVRGFEKGGDDYVIQPYDPNELRIKIKSLLRNKKSVDALIEEIGRLNSAKNELQFSNEDLKKINDRLFETNQYMESLSVTDPVTALFNRKYFHQRFEKELSAVKRYQHQSTALFAEIDGYERIHGNFGELQSHVFLKELASLLVNSVRQSDVVTRYEYGRYGLIFTHTPESKAMIKAQMILDSVSAYPFPLYEDLMPADHPRISENTFSLTVSISVLGLQQPWIGGPADALKSLEQSLKDAGKQGGNMVVLGTSPG